MRDPDHHEADTATWFERNKIVAALVLFGVPFLLAVGLREVGVSGDVAELTQIVVGVTALVVVTVLILRSRKQAG